MADEELLSLLNEWEDVHRDPDKWWVEVNFKALARAFQSVFLEQILPDSDRLGYWLDDKELIKRPIYVRAVVFAIHEYVKEEKDLSGIAWWFEFFKWVLLKPNEPRKEEDVQR